MPPVPLQEIVSYVSGRYSGPDYFTLESANDQRRSGKLAMRLQFDLPRGCYATMLVKRLTQME